MLENSIIFAVKFKKILPSVSDAFKIGTYVKLFKEIKEK